MAHEPGTLRSSPTMDTESMAYDDRVVLKPRVPRLALLLPTTPGAYASGLTSHSGELALGMSFITSSSMYFPVGGPATVVDAATPRSLFFITTSSPITSSFTATPAMAISSAHLPGSVIAASSTPDCRQRMAMWLSRSTGAAVSTAVTPGGMSSSPPSRADITTIGEERKSCPWMSASDVTVTVPANKLSSGAPWLTTIQAERPAAVRMAPITSAWIFDTANMECPRTTSSPKLVRYLWSHPAARPTTSAGPCASAHSVSM
mmetsp:Transcript_34742/g.87127  ORF Transcript_34742/g.87127 Transcript_34742/m.87127 type:complete len:261 (-) Transcript_34742:1915-2697(-)